MALLHNETGGSDCALSDEQRQQLTDYLQSHSSYEFLNSPAYGSYPYFLH